LRAENEGREEAKEKRKARNVNEDRMQENIKCKTESEKGIKRRGKKLRK
jgi:hypothetical protein